MRTCHNCGVEIKLRTVINGKVINCQRRKYCFKCSPFGSGNNKSKKCAAIAATLLPRRPNGSRIRKDQYRKYQKELRKKRKKALVEIFGGKCSICGYNKSYKALEFHHKNSKGKEFNLSCLGYTCKWERLLNEAKKCVLMCANCHRELGDE